MLGMDGGPQGKSVRKLCIAALYKFSSGIIKKIKMINVTRVLNTFKK
jgi:hypothetical protein